MSEVSLENSSINILVEINGKIHLVALSNERLEAIQSLVSLSVEAVIPVGKTQGELNDFLDISKHL